MPELRNPLGMFSVFLKSRKTIRELNHTIENNYIMMKKLTILICFLILTFSATYPVEAQEKIAEKSLKEGLFMLHEIDMHVHAGKERPLSLDQWIDMFIHDGRKVLLLLDHLELYRMSGKEREGWIKKNKVSDWYPDSTSARKEFMKELESVENRKDILAFRGWEIWEGEIDEGLDKAPMRDAEVISWHMSKAAWSGKAPGGKELIIRARQIVEIQKEFPVPMIIFHPFAGRIKAVKDAAVKSGRDISSITREEYRYFTPEEQKELTKILAGRSVYIEIERGWSGLWNEQPVREAFIEDIRPLAEGGVKFTISTDAHGKESFNTPYDPEKYCNDLGITSENVNAIIRELLSFRAKRNLGK